MNDLKYSIIYAVIRPEISERISVGIIIVDGNEIEIRYSDKKLKALQYLFPKTEYESVSKIVRSMQKNKVVANINDIEYLSRYSNNLINVSGLKSVNLEPTDKAKKWLYRSYVQNWDIIISYPHLQRFG